MPTPFVVLDLDVVEDRYGSLLEALPGVRVLYAVKANPAVEVLARLAGLGSSFDVASRGEIDRCLAIGVAPREAELRQHDQEGARHRLRAPLRDHAASRSMPTPSWTRSSARLRVHGLRAHHHQRRRSRLAPVAQIRVRSRSSAGAPAYRRQGRARASASRSMSALSSATSVPGTRRCRPPAELVDALHQEGFTVAGVNLGGGLPCTYRDEVDDVSAYGQAISRAAQAHLGLDFAGELLVEPGRFLVGDAGVIETEVVLISRRSEDAATPLGVSRRRDVQWPHRDARGGDPIPRRRTAGPWSDRPGRPRRPVVR